MKIVNLDIEKPYQILIGKDFLGEYLPEGRGYIICDENTEQYAKHFNMEKIVLPPGENSKSFDTYKNVAEIILEKGLNRKDFLVALGGGVIGDLTGFLASTLLRGIDFIQIPTTLMAMVDSSVGGKTAINSKAGKNLIGTFYQPKKVLIDISVLKTLDKRNLKAGYTEGVKHGLIGDKDYFEWCEKNGEKCLSGDLSVLEYFVEKSVQFKANIVKQDEFETKGIRALLNLGHSFAHVYEKYTNYNPELLLHGEAVGLGIRNSFMLSCKMGLLEKSELDRVLEHFESLKLLDFGNFKEPTMDYLLENMKKDKKNDSTGYNLVLNKRIGESVFMKNVKEDTIINLLHD
ncbi:MAG: 3-dehydroquinate synthase [Rickettsiales bacterium]|jgi:3-dehydroquinate synthase|nr:3-dehydroquinate synthase [Rickettsiales bacterium]